MHIYIYIYNTYIHVCVHIPNVYIYIYDIAGSRAAGGAAGGTGVRQLSYIIGLLIYEITNILLLYIIINIIILLLYVIISIIIIICTFSI